MNNWSQLRFELFVTLIVGIVLLSTGHLVGGAVLILLYGLGSIIAYRSK